MKILVVDDERKMGVIVKGALEREGHQVEAVDRSKVALERILAERFDLLITDLKMAPPDGLELLRRSRAERPDTDVMLMTAYASAETAVEAMQAGACDYLIKPFQLDELRIRVGKLAKAREMGESVRLLERENELLKRDTDAVPRFDRMIAQSPVMRDVFDLGQKVGATEATVLIRGESGTGKSMLARAIHAASPRAAAPFITVNCGALPESLLESELFGHEKGAFTGAVARKAGRFTTAEGGTLFLDEIGEMSAPLQVKLLHVLEEKTFYPVGSEQPLTANVRVIAATNRDLEEAIGEGEFREDLFYRLNVFPIVIPPLAARREDVSLLLDLFLSRFGREPADVATEARSALLTYGYPGNVRELENLVERAVILAGGEPIEKAHFPALGRGTGATSPVGFTVPEIPDDGLRLEDLERELILKALEKAAGNKTRAAQLLGLTRRTLYSRLSRFGLDS